MSLSDKTAQIISLQVIDQVTAQVAGTALLAQVAVSFPGDALTTCRTGRAYYAEDAKILVLETNALSALGDRVYLYQKANTKYR